MQTMLAKSALALAAAGTFLAAVPAAAAPASHAPVASHVVTGAEDAWNDHGRHRGWRGRDRYEDRRHDGYRRYDDDRGYYRDQVSYGEPVYANTRVWQGRDGRHYCRRDDGTTGLLIGAALGGVVGHEVAGRRGDRTLGVILGAAGGALLGREIDRSGARCR